MLHMLAFVAQYNRLEQIIICWKT